MNRPFHDPLKEAFISLIFSLLQNIDPTFNAIVTARNITTSRIYPEMSKKRMPEKLYCARRGLAEVVPEGVIMSLTMLKKSNLELKTL